MPDQFTETKTIGLGNRLVTSVKNVFIGFLLFVASFGVLYWNEGRVDLSTMASQAVEISADLPVNDTSPENQLVSATGEVKTSETVGDDLFLNPGPYLGVERVVEMYAWVENKEEKETTNLGGSQTTETTYTYTKEWVTDPASSSGFKHPEDHTNPSLGFKPATYIVTSATVGIYSFNPKEIVLPDFSDLTLTSDMVKLEGSKADLVNSQYLFIPYSSGSNLTSPVVGDVRISYKFLTSDFEGTIFGKLKAQEISAYFDKDQNELYRLFVGSRDEALSTMHGEYVTMLWLMRALGFLLMWVGLTALFSPFTTLLDVLPILGSLGRGVVGAVMFVIALVLSGIAILISMVLHNLVALIVVAVIALAGIGVAMNVLRKKIKEKQSNGLKGIVNNILENNK